MHRPPSRRAVLGAALTAALGACDPTPGIQGPQAAGGASPAAQAVVTAATGTVVVPDQPLRVVVLDTPELDSAMTLGITPVGASRAAAERGLPSYWPASRLAEVAGTGTIGAPDLAAIRALRPELILSNLDRDGARYDALSRIAPTVLSRGTGYTWKENLQLHARALGRQAAAEAVVTAYRAQLAQTSHALGGPGSTAGRRISVVRFVQGGRIRLYGRQNFLGTILADLQLGRPEAQNVDRFDVEVTPTNWPAPTATCCSTRPTATRTRRAPPRCWRARPGRRSTRSGRATPTRWTTSSGSRASAAPEPTWSSPNSSACSAVEHPPVLSSAPPDPL